MAYDQTQRRDEVPWSQEDREYRRRAPFASAVVCDSGAEQAGRITSPGSGSEEYIQQSWSSVPTYVQPHEAYYHNSSYQQPLLPGHNSAYQYRTSTVAVPQNGPVPTFGCPTPQPYANSYQYESTYSAASYPIDPGYTTVGPAHVSLSPSSPTPSYQSPQYSYAAPTTNVSASPPDVRYSMPLVQSLETSPIDGEYSVPCPYRCGTVLTGVHALGNLTRHLKTQACAGSSRAKVRYPCPIEGCERQYARSDGLRVHMRRRHGAPPPVPRTDGIVDDDEQ
ncbi:hypothetical protein CC77DRAFT_404311 [Alternaria alternata]|uniref:C2H2-type domain-containing protein n=1 Tax=Alternaria alternata TaxID=5599 RepID=A0A177DAC1_ALTAL|nr:hypothetical protein CC77DRAFT_404311 [Alternaria alternata]XP_051590029.1 uncharacterized protein J4E82_003777 [Alternaria postmessia]KAI5377326.1 hypothetical protein J4E82_003777 [Alternaria postmessia]OAG15879.1 hypothetical protein CC77DRAFT_404311 [Alternaria alternata]